MKNSFDGAKLFRQFFYSLLLDKKFWHYYNEAKNSCLKPIPKNKTKAKRSGRTPAGRK